MVHRLFGSMRHWHLVDASPAGSVDERATALLKMVGESPSNHQKWEIRPLQIRAMALELVAAAAQLGEPPGSDLLRLLAWAMNVPETFLDDPSAVMSGRDGKGEPAEPEKRESGGCK
jgi:hypothetical protein